MPLQTAVREHHCAPTLFVDNQPHPGLQFWHSRPLDAAEDFRIFADAGVHIVTTGFMGCTFDQNGAWNTDAVDASMNAVLAANPQALVMPRIPLEPPAWWQKAYPDDVQVHLDVGNGDEIRKMVAFASARWRQDIGDQLPALIRYCEDAWGDQLFGYHLCAGACGEWAYYWGPVISGYAPAQQEAFRNWCKATGRPAPADLPTDIRIRHANAWPHEWSWLRPDVADERTAIDFLTFHSEAVAESICHVSRVAKETLVELRREKIVGVFYGYHFGNTDTPGVAHNAGHHALDRVLASPDVDFIAAPMTYHERQAGGHYYAQLPPATVRLHGKLYYNEDDTFTHLARETPWRPRCRDAAETADVLWRNLGATLTERGAYWWMDHDGDGWYRDDALMHEVARMQAVAADLAETGHTPNAQAALVVNPQSMNHLRYDPSLVDALLPKLLSELTSLGAPYDVIHIDDLDTLLADGRHRLLIFPDSLFLNDTQRTSIHNAKRAGRTLLFIYAAGLLTDDAVSTDAMTRLTGFPVRLCDLVRSCKTETNLDGTRLTYGTDRDIGPQLVADASRLSDTIEVLGHDLYRGEPSLLRRRTDDCTTIWSAAPMLPAPLLRQFAAEAGVHVYLDTGDKVWASSRLLVIHAVTSGEKRVSLPSHSHLINLRTDTDLGNASHLAITMKRGQTAVFQLA